jgi:hypothetical protein
MTAATPESLRALAHDQLLERYRHASAPTSVDDLDGDPAGVGLGLGVLAGSRLDRWLRRRAARPDFVWHGKSFRSVDAARGYGFNRFGRGPVLGALAFRTEIANSQVDGRPTIALDFDITRNPRPQRAALDELREVFPGIYMGPTGVRFRGRYRVLAWFAIDTTRQVELVAAAASHHTASTSRGEARYAAMVRAG